MHELRNEAPLATVRTANEFYLNNGFIRSKGTRQVVPTTCKIENKIVHG